MILIPHITRGDIQTVLYAKSAGEMPATIWNILGNMDTSEAAPAWATCSTWVALERSVSGSVASTSVYPRSIIHSAAIGGGI